MILVDLSHTSHTRARTGIQRVARCLTRELEASSQGAPITWDPHARHWRALEPWEQATLAGEVPGHSRGTNWPLGARLRGRWRRLSRGGPGLPAQPAGSPAGALLPELFSPAVAAALPALRAAQGGPVVALFHDAIALRRPALFPRQTVARFPSYLRELAGLDGVAAVSEDSRRCLSEYWDWLGLKDRPPLLHLTPGIDAPVPPRTTTPGAPARAAQGRPPDDPELLCLCTLEGRKNHLALLEACERLWTLGHRFRLHLVGLARRESAGEALARIESLRAAGRPLQHSGVVDEAGLEAAYAACDFTVYPSLEEGYGLPVVESLIRGKPCVCSANGALGEISRGGGCLSLGGLDAGNLAASLSLLLRNPGLRTQLEREAAARKFRSWKACSEELVAWMGTLARR
jgi:glycosyltransferase involved in cell wall biosynthesis